MKNIPKASPAVRAVVAVILVAGISVTYLVKTKPLMFNFVAEMIGSIVTPKQPLNNELTPARDLRGSWKSSLLGKGLQLYGRHTTDGAITDVYEDGDIELIINDVKDNVAVGTMRYTNLCSWGETTVTIPGAERVISVPKTCVADTGQQEISIRVSSSALDFGTVSVDGVTATMQGSFTTDIMSGSMTVTMPGGILKGTFNLSRQK
ncbi:MAG: hypothetical protein WC693_00730 [Patescibacteria group bacterium]|jgi:hypothetical protein